MKRNNVKRLLDCCQQFKTRQHILYRVSARTSRRWSARKSRQHVYATNIGLRLALVERVEARRAPVRPTKDRLFYFEAGPAFGLYFIGGSRDDRLNAERIHSQPVSLVVANFYITAPKIVTSAVVDLTISSLLLRFVRKTAALIFGCWSSSHRSDQNQRV